MLRRGLSSVAIAGIAVAAVVAHSALTAAFLFYRGRKSTQKASRDSSRINKSQKRLENANTGASTPEETSSYATPDKPRRPRRPHTSYQQQDHYFEVSPPSLRVPSSPVFEIPRTQPPVNEPRRPPTKIPSTQDYYFEVSPPIPPVFEIITSPIQPSVDEVELFVSALRSPPESSSTQDYRFDVSRSSRTRPIPRSITSPTQSSVDEPRSSRRPPTEPPGTQDYHFEVSPPSRTRRVPRLRVPRPHVFEIMTSPTQSSIDEPRSSRHPPPEAPPYQNIIQQPVPNESENANSGASTPVEASGYTTCDAY
ncbi:hypothetical protein DFH29DRAFT_927543 [Suillus ampliporus]|nr:hypothetical protein DFH29DRAFT_927543 [Suillus ampliporus]